MAAVVAAAAAAAVVVSAAAFYIPVSHRAHDFALPPSLRFASVLSAPRCGWPALLSVPLDRSGLVAESLNARGKRRILAHARAHAPSVAPRF